MTNILEAIHNIVEHRNFTIREQNSGRNRANNMGVALENYIKDAFANTLSVSNVESKLEVYNETFSWLGSQNNPPDIMIRGGDAIEVKKTQSERTSLALNSSYPKTNLMHTSPMITTECKECETWTIKDIIYCVGHTSDTNIISLWMLYGSLYAAKHETYQRIKTTISSGINEIPDVVFSETKELGRINQVDPLGITNLRVRGMWQIENPRKVFEYIHPRSDNNFELVCLIPKEKYDNFPETSRSKIEDLTVSGFNIQDKRVKDPNNPANLLDCKLIKFCI
jgi:hypothetical protein